MKKTVLAAALLASVNASAMQLDLDNKYVGGSVHLSDLDYGDDNAVGFGVAVGAPVKNLNMAPGAKLDVAVEAGYIYFGETEYGWLDWSSSASSIYGATKIGTALTEEFSVFGKAGLGIVFEEYETAINKYDNTYIGILFGAGAGYQLTDKLGVSAEYVFYPGGVSSLSGGVSFKF